MSDTNTIVKELAKYNIKCISLDYSDSFDSFDYMTSVRPTTPRMDWTPSYYQYQTVVTMSSNLHSVDRLVNHLVRSDQLNSKQSYEEYIRYNNPAVQNAYSQYQMLLSMASY
jgi:hypothetical protein